MKISSILRRARYKIRKPGLWGKGPHLQSDRLCIVQAIESAVPPFSPMAFIHRVVGRFSEAIGGGSVIEWNDSEGCTHAQVLHAFDRAIALAEKEEVKR